jgi:hypothetical protein
VSKKKTGWKEKMESFAKLDGEGEYKFLYLPAG